MRTWGLLIGVALSLAVTLTVMFTPPLTAVLALFYNQAIDGRTGTRHRSGPPCGAGDPQSA